jgi:hypothetical protein
MNQILREARTKLRGWRVCLTLLAFLGLAAAAGKAAAPGAGGGSAHRSAFGVDLVIADLDGDSRPDMASVSVAHNSQQSTDYFIRLQFSTAADATIGLTARAGGLDLAQSDVNGDSILDVVVRTALDSKVVAVLVNDGHGKFSLADPSSFSFATATADNFLQVPLDPTQDLTVIAPMRSAFGQRPEGRATLLAPGAECAVSDPTEASVAADQAFCQFGRPPPASIHTT